MSYTEWMKKRTSWRTYDGKKLREKDRTSLENRINTEMDTPFGNKPHFRLIEKDFGDGKIGTYGFIRGAQQFIVGAVEEAPMNIEDYGYALEKIILYATGLGLGTCWLGGTFTRDIIRDLLSLKHDETLPAITPVGYKKERGLLGKVIRWGGGSRNRKPWEELFFLGDLDTPLSMDEVGVYSNAFEMVRIGPSATNSQPWRLVLDRENVHFYCDADEYSINKRLDMGIAFSHFELALREEDIEGTWSRRSGLESGYVASWSRI